MHSAGRAKTADQLRRLRLGVTSDLVRFCLERLARLIQYAKSKEKSHE